jgi:hypothetical protein
MGIRDRGGDGGGYGQWDWIGLGWLFDLFGLFDLFVCLIVF